MVELKGWRYAGFIGGIVAVIGAAVYPVVIYPMLNVDKYSESIKIWKLIYKTL